MVLHPAIQPTLCVIGYPVAGNAMQFAFERSLQEAGLDWKFVSFNVQPDSFDEAVRGVKALGLAGVAIASPFETQASGHAEQFTTGSAADLWIDFLQPLRGTWVGSNQLGRAVYQLTCEAVPDLNQVWILGTGPQARGIAAYFTAHSQPCTLVSSAVLQPTVAAGAPASDAEESVAEAESEPLVTSAVLIRADSDDGTPCPIEQLEIEACHNVGCCVELSLDPATRLPSVGQAASVSAVDVLVQRFANGFQDWTGLPSHPSTLREAVEEYFEL
ncbi:shikimate 5-dehydrogenase [Rosistilla carotiformis]|uniref:Shikimate 5-dehydrogenase n=1 Tax=Rosistilla carotiformis TaxID=2528017 RepID=A0A518JQI7_9BACT|nr:hypothetical protein [Rosistilla carotiformis]QDV67807.1 shikimate 5-dehydrogenase [Rosistilla carotiformis]